MEAAIDLLLPTRVINVLSQMYMYPMKSDGMALHLLDKEPSLAVVFVSGRWVRTAA